jgi:hypothetical protein
MDPIEQRLRETSDDCIKAYAAWNSGKKNAESREALMEAVHELRKVAARLEIELAVSERQEVTGRPLPIPPHRSSARRGGELPDFITDGGDDSAGNQSESAQPQPQQRSGGFQRRPMRRPQQGGGNNPRSSED